MKFNATKIMAAIALLSGSSVASADANWDNLRFVHDEDPVSSAAACLVSVGNPGPGIHACLCAAFGGNDSGLGCTAEDDGAFAIYPGFEASWAAALDTNDTYLYADVADGYSGQSPLDDDEWWNVKMDARGSCSLTQASLELAVDFDPKDAKRRLRGLVGAKAAYSAVYMIPVRAPGTDKEDLKWEGLEEKGGDPVRLCALGQAQVFTAGSFRRESHHYHGHGHSADVSADLSALQTGVSGAAQWVVKNFPEDQNGINTFGVKYVVVAGVADALLRVGKKQFAALGVLANTKVTDRSLFIVRSNDYSNDFFHVQDEEVLAPEVQAEGPE